MIEIQCTSCHTRYRIDEQVLPEGTPTFKCSRCGHVFSFEPRAKDPGDTDAPTPQSQAEAPQKPRRAYSSPQKLAPLKTGSATGRNGEIKEALEGIAAARAEGGAKSSSFRAWQEANQPEEADTATPPDSERTPGGAAEGGNAMSHPAGREDMTPAEGDSTAHDDPLARPFGRATEESEQGENLAFDFNDEQSEPSESGETDEHLTADSEDKWQVGDPDDVAGVERDRTIQAQRAMELGATAAAPPRPRTRRPRKRPFDEDFVDESAAPLYGRAATHSSRLFLGLFLVVVVAYGLLALMIHSAPAAASEMLSRVPLLGERFVPPVTPASLVALRNVNSNYQRIKGGHNALVITGEAENVAGTPLHVVRIKVDLRDTAQRTVDRHEVYCGNNLTPKMVGEMTPHEIDFFQKLDPPKTFTLAAADKCPFTLVFIDPPGGVARFDIAVAQAIPAPAQTAASNDF